MSSEGYIRPSKYGSRKIVALDTLHSISGHTIVMLSDTVFTSLVDDGVSSANSLTWHGISGTQPAGEKIFSAGKFTGVKISSGSIAVDGELIVSASSPALLDYYVSNTGSDSNDGKTPAAAWLTINKVNNATLIPGDIVGFEKGGVWRETLVVPDSGTSNDYIEFTSYGTGDNPKILGSEAGTGWVNTSGNVWEAQETLLDPAAVDNGMEIWFEETGGGVTWGNPKKTYADLSELTLEYDWTWNGNTIYVYSTTDPGSAYSSVEIGQRDQCINLDSKQYIEIDGVDLFYTVWGVESEYPQAGYTGFIMRNLESAYTGIKDGTSAASSVCYNDSLFENLHIHNHGRRGLSIINYGASDISNIIVQDCVFHDGFHTTGVDLETGGTGGATGNLSDIHIRRNHISDPESRVGESSELIFCQGPHGDSGQILGVYVYNNVLKFTGNRAVAFEDVDLGHCYFNTFYGHNDQNVGNTFHFRALDFSTNIEVKNNIFYSLLSYDTNSSGVLIYQTNGSQATAEMDVDYNLYYRSTGRIIETGTGTYYMGDMANVRTDLGWETNGDDDNPNFTDGPNDNYHLKTGSPALGAGLAIAGYETDYDGVARSSPPAIGAFETIED